MIFQESCIFRFLILNHFVRTCLHTFFIGQPYGPEHLFSHYHVWCGAGHQSRTLHSVAQPKESSTHWAVFTNYSAATFHSYPCYRYAGKQWHGFRNAVGRSLPWRERFKFLYSHGARPCCLVGYAHCVFIAGRVYYYATELYFLRITNSIVVWRIEIT